MGIRERLSGNEAVSYAIKQINPDVMPAFPITPSTEIPQIPQPLQWFRSKSRRLPPTTGMQLSGQTGAHNRQCTHLLSSMTGVAVLHSPVLNALEVPPPYTWLPGVISVYLLFSCILIP